MYALSCYWLILRIVFEVGCVCICKFICLFSCICLYLYFSLYLMLLGTVQTLGKARLCMDFTDSFRGKVAPVLETLFVSVLVFFSLYLCVICVFIFHEFCWVQCKLLAKQGCAWILQIVFAERLRQWCRLLTHFLPVFNLVTGPISTFSFFGQLNILFWEIVYRNMVRIENDVECHS